jgi:O-antigen/teichoic acid export membrane protein
MQVITIYIFIYGLESIASVFGITRKALGQFKLISFIIGLNRLIRLAVIFGVMFYLKGDLTMLVWAFLIERVVTTIISALSTLRLFKIEVDLTQLKPMFKDSLGFGILDSLDGIQGRIDRVMLQALIGPTAVAFYAIPAKLNRNTQMVLKSITQVFLPSMHDTIINDRNKFKTITQHLSRFLAVSGSFVLILVYFYSEDILLKIFGSEYSGSLYIAKLFAFVNLMWFLQKTPDLILMSQAAHGKRLWGQIIGIGTNVGANYILITRYGLDGAVYATMLANLVTLVFSASFCHKYLEIGRCIAIIIVPVVMVFFLPIYYLVIFYVAYLFIAKLVSKEDISSIINAFKDKSERSTVNGEG